MKALTETQGFGVQARKAQWQKGTLIWFRVATQRTHDFSTSNPRPFPALGSPSSPGQDTCPP